METDPDKLYPLSVPGSSYHDLTRVQPGDKLVFDTINNGQYNGHSEVVRINKPYILMKNDEICEMSTGRVSGYQHAVFRKPKENEIELNRRRGLVSRMQSVEYHMMPLKLLLRLNEVMDAYEQSRDERKQLYETNTKLRKSYAESQATIASNPKLSANKWANLGSSLKGWDAEENDMKQKKFWKKKVDKVKKKKTRK